MKHILLILLMASAFFLLGCDSDSDDNETNGTDVPDATDTETSMDMGSDSTASSDDPTYTDITGEQVMTMMASDDNVVVVDVSPLYDDGHIPGAINFYIGGTELDAALPLIDKSFSYIIYCHTDAASIPGAQKFVDGGFPNVYRLEGNYSAWTAAGHPVEVTGDGYMDVSPATAKVLIDGNPNVVTIDVSPLYASGHLPGAVNYPLGDGSLAAAAPTLDDSKSYLVYCHGDTPSIAGSELLFDEGLSPVYRLEGNYGAWTAKEFPVEM